MFLNFRLWQLTQGVRLRIFFAVFVGVISSTVGVVRLALLGWLLALIFQGAGFDDILVPAVIIAGVMVLRGVLDHLRIMVAHETASRVQLLLRKRLFHQVVTLGPAYFSMNRTGDVLLTMVEGVEQLETYFGKYLPQLFVAIITPLVIFSLLAFWDLVLASILLGFAWLTLLTPALFHTWDSKNSLRRQKAYAKYAADFLDTIQGLATLKAFGQAAARGRLLAKRAHEVYRSTMWVLATNSLTRGITDTGIALGAAVLLGYGAYRVQMGVTSLETLLIILMAGVEVFRPQRDMRALLHEGMVGLSAAHGVFALLDARSPIDWPTEVKAVNAQVKKIVANVTFDQVTFAYPGGRQPAHTGLSFNVAEGERIGFVGSSGAGKSTIMKLLLRFHDADQGKILIGGYDIRSLTTEALYQQLAVVSQDTYLFHGTVADNLRFGRMQASNKELQHAARQANAHEFIEQLPQDYDTVIGERGIRLSGGQRQRIAIARALLRDAPILVLDEALSAVDAENEAVIQQALDRLMQGRTTLIFAHRLSSVIGCDRIIVLDGGQVVESGTHGQLLAQHDYYWRLMASQLGGNQQTTLSHEAAVDDCVNNGAKAVSGIHQQDKNVTDDILQAKGLGWRGVIHELSGYVSAYKGRLTMTFLFGVLRVLSFIGVGVLSALIVAAVKTDQPYDDLLIWLGVLAAASGLLHWLESWVAHDMAFRMLADLRAKLYAKLEALAPAFLVRRRSGDMVAMATHDVEMVEYFFAHTVAPAFVAILVPALVLLVLGWHNWLLAFVLVPFLLIVGLSPFLLRRRIDDLGSRARESLAELNAYIVDSIQGLHEIIAFRQVAQRREAFVTQVKNHLSIRQPFLRDLSWQTALLEIVTGLGGLVIVMIGAYLASTGDISDALLPMLTLLALSAFLPVSEIAQVSRQLANTLGATRRLYAVQTAPVAVTDGVGVSESVVDQQSVAALEMNTVNFTYEAGHVAALQGISFSVPMGSTVALVGSSGSGKTTIAHLLLRFWDPSSGTIQLQGHDLRDYPLDELRARIALVSQDTYLFNATLRENILMARPEADEQAINDAIRRAALEVFVANQPEGLDTPVGERGLRLSGGQRQRVAIARAFLKDAPILILDEATSHLDAVSEATVRRSLEDLMHDRTTIVIAHRLSTVRNADKIVVLKAGEVVEIGSHDELLNKGGMYKQLVSRQLGAES